MSTKTKQDLLDQFDVEAKQQGGSVEAIQKAAAHAYIELLADIRSILFSQQKKM